MAAFEWPNSWRTSLPINPPPRHSKLSRWTPLFISITHLKKAILQGRVLMQCTDTFQLPSGHSSPLGHHGIWSHDLDLHASLPRLERHQSTGSLWILATAWSANAPLRLSTVSTKVSWRIFTPSSYSMRSVSALRHHHRPAAPLRRLPQPSAASSTGNNSPSAPCRSPSSAGLS